MCTLNTSSNGEETSMNITSRVATLGAIVASLVGSNVALAGSPDDWAGPYLGLQAGYGSDDSVTLTNDAGVTSDNFDMRGSIGGGQIGYNWAVGAMVIGLEATASAANIDGSSTCFVSPLDTCGANLGELYTVRGRIGVPFNNFLLYGSLGEASGKIKVRHTIYGVETTDSGYHNGYFAGFGGALALNLHWNVIGEFQYVRFGSNRYNLTTPVTMKSEFVTLSLGMNYKF